MAIYFYKISDEYGCFSNFAHYNFELGGKRWITSEHYFQAQKFCGTKIEGRSIFCGTVDDAQKLVDEFAGTGVWIGKNKERVNFGMVIGKYVNPSTGESIDTTIGMIHYSKTGTHIIPAQPIE